MDMESDMDDGEMGMPNSGRLFHPPLGKNSPGHPMRKGGCDERIIACESAKKGKQI